MTRPAVMVTGGAGYIGSHTCKALFKHGFLPVTLDDLSLGQADFVRWGPLIQSDTRDTAKLVRVLNEHQVAAVVHFAALSAVGESMAEPDRYYDVNVGGTLSLLNALKAARVMHLVFSSTAAVYGEPETVPIDETAPTRPLNAYGRTKLACEGMIADYAAAFGLKATILRYFNACGADPETEIGEFRKMETHLIPRAMMSLLGHLDRFEVFGSDFPTPDGTAIRDYIHVSDLAEAHVLALRQLMDGGPGLTLNLGTGQGYSVAEVLAAVGQASGRPMAAPRGGRRPGDPARLVARADRAREALGFVPRHSDLATIARTAWAWHQKAHPQKSVET